MPGHDFEAELSNSLGSTAAPKTSPATPPRKRSLVWFFVGIGCFFLILLIAAAIGLAIVRGVMSTPP